MASVQVFQPFQIFNDINGRPVDDGFIWIGQPSLDPETNQISVFFDEALTIPATQPIRTRNGAPSNAGAQARLYVSAVSFSVKVENKNGTLISQTTITDPLSLSDGSSLVGFIQTGTGAVARNSLSKMREHFSVKDFGAVGDGVNDDTPYIQAALTAAAAAGGGGVSFPLGNYKVTAPVFLENASKVALIGEDGAVVFKDSSFPADGYIYYAKFSDDMSVEGLAFTGKTSSTTAIAFGDHGVGFFSCNRSRITKNRFKNLGDGAVVVASYTLSSPPSAVDHYGSLVADNFFENCFQTSTTPGGTAGMIFARNNASNLKGSFKFASRLPGADSLIVVDNIVNSAAAVGSAVGIEMSSYSNVLISGNELNNCPSVGITCYTNTFAGVAGFQWKNLKIVNNTLRNVAVGIRVSNDAYPDASRFVLESCDISGNTIDTASSFGVLVANGAFSGLSVNRNTIYRTTSYPISIDLLCLNSLSLTDSIQVRGNIIRDCTALGPFIRPNMSSDRLLVSAEVSDNLVRNTGAFSLERISELGFTNNTANLLATLAVTDCVSVNFLDNRITSTAIALNLLATGANVARNRLTGTTAAFRTAVGASAINELDNIFSGPLVFNVQPVGESSLGAKRRHLGTAAPTSGAWLQGEIIWNSAPVTGSVAGFLCTASGTPGTWRAFCWSVNRGVTGSRPTLTAGDVGVMYMDNTLDADGKPIWWNGTAWVDATGAVV